MADQKKFLDAEGVKYLWSKINMQDYPNNETLMDIIEAIDETKADKSELPGWVQKELVHTQTLVDGESVWDNPNAPTFKNNTTYIVNYDGIDYIVYTNSWGGYENDISNYPFNWHSTDDGNCIEPKESGDHTYYLYEVNDIKQFDDVLISDNIARQTDVEALYKKLNSNTLLGFYCIEDVTVVVNDVSTVYPANSNVEIKLADDDVFEIIPTSDNSILSLTAFPGALGTFYPWLEGVAQFANILFDMNNVDFYSKWSQGNQGAYHVQKAQYLNCVFWSDNPYISDVSQRTNYTLTHTSELPLCYSSIPDNTFKSFYLAFGVNSDPNWANQAYKDSFAKANWATQVFSYYGARTIGIVGHDDPDFNIVLPKDCRGLMFDARNIENAGTFDAINTTTFGAKSGSWRDAFGYCISLKRLYIKNLTVNLNVSWSPIDYDSITYIIGAAANTKKITISVSPYTYNLLSAADFEAATAKNIAIELITTNYVEDNRLSEISNKADKSYVDERVAALVGSAPETLDTLEELATALQENDEVVQVLNDAIVTKADKTYVDEAIANIPTESDVFIVDCPDGSVISHTFEQIMAAVNSGKAVYASTYGTVSMPLTYVADDNSYIEFHAINAEVTEDQYALAWVEGLRINNDNSFTIKFMDLLTRRIEEIQSPDGEKDIVVIINRLLTEREELKSVSVTEDEIDGLSSLLM